MSKNTEVKGIKPFLRWAGGKTWLIRHLDNIVGDIEFKQYHEPFLGGGAIFFSMDRDQDHTAFLSDLNQELIDTYSAVRDNPEKVINILKTYQNNEEFYYHIRQKVPTDFFDKAARFIYLNQTSFNGLYRVNQQGTYNVPYGHRKKEFLEEDKLIATGKLLKNTMLSCGDFTCNRNYIKKGDLVFLDPPYTVSHNNNGFIKYNQKLFSIEDQIRLAKFIDYIREQEAYYILTNAAHQIIFDIFGGHDRCIELTRANLIGGKNAKRGSILEYVFTNIPGGIG